MSRDVVMVAPDLKVQDFIDKVLRNNRFTSFPVAVDGKLHGLIVLEELKGVPREKWAGLTTAEVMKPVDESMFIRAGAAVAQAKSLLSRNGIGRAAVLDDRGLVVGYISRSDVEKE
jgi:CBS domain-containing protein